MITNIRNRFSINRHLAVIFLFLAPAYACAQGAGYTRPAVTDKYKVYKKQVKADPDKKMTDLKKMIPALVYDLRYATVNNFMKRNMYPAGTNKTFLRLPAAHALHQVQQELNQKGLGLKIYDAYRPYSVTVKFWELVKDERYVANPSRGSGHNKGTTVDLTLINLQTKNELNMGTDFDNFSDSAHHEFTELPEEVLQNRILLKTTMEKYGFKAYDDEWWHYTFSNGKQYEILDIDFKKLKRRL